MVGTKRNAAVDSLQKVKTYPMLGDRVAVYGKGWEGPCLGFITALGTNEISGLPEELRSDYYVDVSVLPNRSFSSGEISEGSGPVVFFVSLPFHFSVPADVRAKFSNDYRWCEKKLVFLAGPDANS